MWRDILFAAIFLVLIAGVMWFIWAAFASKRRRRSKMSRTVGSVASFGNTFFYKTNQEPKAEHEQSSGQASRQQR